MGAVKVALVTKGRAKAKKVQKVQKKVQKKKVNPESIVPESDHAEMMTSHFFDGSATQHKAKKAKAAPVAQNDALNGMHLMGMAPTLKRSAHATNALTNMASSLLSEARDKVAAKAAKKAAKAKAKAKKAKKAAAAVDPFKMDLS